MTLVSDARKKLMDMGSIINDNNGIIDKPIISERIEYDISSTCKELEIDREFNIHMQLKDLFSGAGSGDSEDFLNPRILELYKE
jgi:hypothetical protein